VAWPTVDADTPTLAWGVIELAESYLLVPSGVGAGLPLKLTREQIEFLVAWYSVDVTGRSYNYRRGMLRMPKGWAKSPLGAVYVFAGLVGDVVPDGLDANGSPVGRPHPRPWIQVAATSEDQTDNLYAQLYDMLRGSAAVDDFGLDMGTTRIQTKGRGGRIEPVTSSAGAREGQPISDVVLEETHLWHRSNGGKALAAVLRRNAAKMNARSLELTNAYEPGAGSVAESSEETILSGRVAGALLVSREAPPLPDLKDPEKIREGLSIAYGEAAIDRGGWVDLDRLVAEALDTEPAEYRRFYFNQVVAPEAALVDLPVWDQLADSEAKLNPGDTICIGFDGSDAGSDSTALVAVRWPDWTVFVIKVWEAPDGAVDWMVPRNEVDAVVHETCAQYNVVRGYFDPPRWATEIDNWGAELGNAVLRWPHASDRRIAGATERLESMVRTGTIHHNADPTLRRHLANARKEKCRSEGYRPAKKTQGHPIDAASALLGAIEALGDAIAHDEVAPQPVRKPIFAY
jgi:hypothetical protein